MRVGCSHRSWPPVVGGAVDKPPLSKPPFRDNGLGPNPTDLHPQKGRPRHPLSRTEHGQSLNRRGR
eukprot:8528019-Pyramimonas_sp.AAC.1